MISNKEIQDAITAYLERTMPKKTLSSSSVLEKAHKGQSVFPIWKLLQKVFVIVIAIVLLWLLLRAVD